MMSGPARGAALVERAAEAAGGARRRAEGLRWGALNAALLLALAYDLSCACPGYTTALHYVELSAAALAAANLLHHALRLLPRPAPALRITRAQQRLLGLTDADLDSSFQVVENEPAASASPSASEDSSESLCVSQWAPHSRWRPHSPSLSSASSAGSPHGSPHSSPHSSFNSSLPSSLHSSVTDLFQRSPATKDEFISDHDSLTDYLKQYEARRALAGAPQGGCGPPWAAPPPLYHTAPLDYESRGAEERAGGAALSALPHLDPQRLAQYTYNLRLWIQLTILERLVSQLEAGDAALSRLGLGARLGELPAERLRAVAAAPAARPGPLPRLLPFLEPFADQQYVVRRIRELAAGGCLSGYKWDGGGSEWRAGRPTDAELVLQLFCTYMDLQLPPAAAAKPFSSLHVSAAPAPPAPPPSVHRTSRPPAPPHYVVNSPRGLLEPPRGPHNLLLALLLLLSALARHPPRAALGPAGLNLLWVIGR